MDLTSSKILLGAGGASGSESYWIREFEHSSLNIYGGGVCVDGSSPVYLNARLNDSNNHKPLQIQLDKDGNVQWQTELVYAYSNPYWAYQSLGSPAVDSAGNVYYTAYADMTGNNTGKYYGLLIKYNSSGTIQWQQRLSLSGNNMIYYAPIVDSSNNVYVPFQVGLYSHSYKGGLVKYNSSGVLQWQRNQWINGIALYGANSDVDSSGNIYQLSYARSSTYANFEPKVFKYNSSGTIQWQKRLRNSNYHVFPAELKVDNSGNIYILTEMNYDCYLIKLNSSFVIQWEKQLDGGGWTVARKSLCLDSAGNPYILVTSNSNSDIVKYNSSGTLQWQRRIAAGTYFNAYNITVNDNADAIYLNGVYYHSWSTPPARHAVLKLPADGS